jgi:hypothetical protein
MLKYCYCFLFFYFFILALSGEETKPKLKQLGVQDSEDDLGLNSEHRENYYFLESERQKRAGKKSQKTGLGIAPSKDLPKQFEENNFDLNKTWQEIDPLNPPLQLEFEGDF